MSRRPSSTKLTPDQKKIAAENYPLAFEALRRYRPVGEDASDEMLSAAFEGLIAAARAYNPDSGWKFSTYAMPAMRRSMKRAADCGVIRVPAYLFQGRRKAASEESVRSAARATSIMSVHPMDPDDRNFQVPDRAPYDEQADADREEKLARLRRAIYKLPPLHRDVVAMKLDGLNNKEIGQKIGKSQAFVTYLVHRAIGMMREAVGENSGLSGEAAS